VRGPSLTALRPVRIAIAGPACLPWIGGQPAAALTTLELSAGDLLSLPHNRRLRGLMDPAFQPGLRNGAIYTMQHREQQIQDAAASGSGDVLGTARDVVSDMRMSAPRWRPPPLERILPGPQATRDALERLDGAELRTATGDRTGVRLEGPSIPGGESVSEPPPLGAVQITPNGDPFVLLVDRYRTGGYAKPAVVHPDDLPIIGQLLPGMRVHFKLVEPALRWDLAQ
jgi:allophanate hydrolase subunit 2